MPARSDLRHGDHRFGAVVTLLAVWLVASLHLIGWADERGLITDPNFSPYQLPGYIGLIGLVVVVVERLLAGRERGHWATAGGWRSTVPRGYEVVIVGTFVLVAFVVVDQLWIALFGLESGIGSNVAPTRLLLAVGLVLVAIGPLAAARLDGPTGAIAVASLIALVGVLAAGIVGWALASVTETIVLDRSTLAAPGLTSADRRRGRRKSESRSEAGCATIGG